MILNSGMDRSLSISLSVYANPSTALNAQIHDSRMNKNSTKKDDPKQSCELMQWAKSVAPLRWWKCTNRCMGYLQKKIHLPTAPLSNRSVLPEVQAFSSILTNLIVWTIWDVGTNKSQRGDPMIQNDTVILNDTVIYLQTFDISAVEGLIVWQWILIVWWSDFIMRIPSGNWHGNGRCAFWRCIPYWKWDVQLPC